MSFSFYDVWNSSLENREERPLTPRDRIWASEIGGSMIDRYLKMKGTAPSNPPNPRSLRKFEAGNTMEWLVGIVLKRAGILIESQEWLSYAYPKMLPVMGKLDYLAGGTPDYKKAEAELERLESAGFPPVFLKIAKNIVDNFIQKFPFGMNQIVLEVKSCSSFMYDNYERSGTGSMNHMLQTFHYLKAKEMYEGHVVYISKDDLRMLEIAVFNPSPIEAIYKEDIATMTAYIDADERPPLEKEIVFDEQFCKFSHNWKVGYSNYLSMLYGFENQKEFDDKNRPMVAKWNRVYQRCLDDKTMTAANKEVIAEITKAFPNFEEYVVLGKEMKAKGLIAEGGEDDVN